MDSIWEEAIAQVDLGWPKPPWPLVGSGGVKTIAACPGNVTWRIAALQMGGILAFGDFKYGRVDLACTVRTPIMLPTWGHIGQMCLEAPESCADSGFL